MAKFEKNSKEFMLMRDYYVLMQEFWEPSESDIFWENFMKRADQFIRKYDMNLFARDLVQALVAELERKLKR